MNLTTKLKTPEQCPEFLNWYVIRITCYVTLWFDVYERIYDAAVDDDFEVQVDASGAADVACVALFGYQLALLHELAGSYVELGSVAVASLKSIAVVDEDHVAIAVRDISG